MTKTAMMLMLGASLASAGCATYGGYRPVVDTMGDPNAVNVSRDEADCREFARQASRTATQAATGGVVGGLLGAASGAAIGAATGNAGKGAAIGGAAGGLAGGAYKGIEADQDYQSAFRTCMRNRGHNVIN
jgi:outer membrane lipoprotein SlyB